MGLGKTILSTKVGVVGENLTPEEEALFVEPGDAVGLAAAIQRLVRDPKLLGKLATNARNAYDQYFGFRSFWKRIPGGIGGSDCHWQAKARKK